MRYEMVDCKIIYQTVSDNKKWREQYLMFTAVSGLYSLKHNNADYECKASDNSWKSRSQSHKQFPEKSFVFWHFARNCPPIIRVSLQISKFNCITKMSTGNWTFAKCDQHCSIIWGEFNATRSDTSSLWWQMRAYIFT